MSGERDLPTINIFLLNIQAVWLTTKTSTTFTIKWNSSCKPLPGSRPSPPIPSTSGSSTKIASKSSTKISIPSALRKASWVPSEISTPTRHVLLCRCRQKCEIAQLVIWNWFRRKALQEDLHDCRKHHLHRWQEPEKINLQPLQNSNCRQLGRSQEVQPRSQWISQQTGQKTSLLLLWQHR